ncbi:MULTISPECIES: DUF3060 domain-containing protein [unclassified Rhodococcus (in: high G+C Gram-positive bacteria)]|uniref:DUF3060 domain-containing protein n=1 Tax=unclassified Rhodococcus (in: high G+C Gram-positive bacteria) TaxID=192944 RepID=UPI0016399C81|nr:MULTISPECIES: DUF3060 domain-containing protein [unclassified Rhodococcus (in: high G+C Gram-positive bacteria)]MBC2642545.1 DUF3060 domain-containing protein [Rhodococcus sp. 3A]MBC2892713.1 DUF3060 domain-containing protein [Rhodococcus sp. 4CII]
MHNLRRSGFRAAATIACLVVVAAASGGCGRDAAHDSEPARGDGSAVELNSGGDCAGRDVIVNKDGAGVVLDGECGTVTIEANGVSANVARSNAVIVRGQDTGLVGGQTGTLTIAGRSNSATIDVVESIDLQGNAVTVLGTQAERISVGGSGNSVNVDDSGAMTVSGNDNVVRAVSLDSLDVSGSNNTVDWDSGATAAAADTGSANRLTPPGA